MRIRSAFLVLPLLFGAELFAADLPSADSLLKTALDKNGGENVLARAKNAVMTGTVEMAGHNIGGPVSIYQDGSRSYTSIDIPGIGKVEEGYDGQTAWEMNALQGARIKDGEEKADSVRAARVSPLSAWREDYTAAKTLGTEDVNGKPAWKIEMTPRTGKPEVFYFDKQTMLLVRTAATIATALGDIPVDVALENYRVVDGIETPFQMTQNAMGQKLIMRFDKVRYNAPIPPGTFDLPQAVKDLLAQKKP